MPSVAVLSKEGRGNPSRETEFAEQDEKREKG